MTTKRPSLAVSFLPLLTMFVCFVVGAIFLDMGTELLVVVMLISATVAGVIAVRTGHTWDEIQESTGDKIASVLPAVLILLMIGMLIGAWVFSGTIPLMVSLGIEMVTPKYLVPTAFLATATMSLCTGTSWGSAGTIGVALMGIAAAFDAPMAATAGAVVSGAYFGDKLSPLSDSTNICAIGAKADLYAHIRHLMYSSVPSFVIALIAYVAVGSLTAAATSSMPDSARRLLTDIDLAFSLRWWTLIPPAVVVVGTIKRYPPVLVMAASSLTALLVGLFGQGFAVQDALAAAVSGFDVEMVKQAGIDPTMLSDTFRDLLNRGGLYSMVNTLLVIIAAFLLAAAMDVSGALDNIINAMLSMVRSTFGLVAATMSAGATMISLTSHGGVTALVIGGLFQKAYQERGLAPENLSRSLEDSVTIVEPLMPWTVSAVFMATTLGVPTVAYAPWAVFCYCGPIFSLLIAATFDRTRFGMRVLETVVI